MSDYIKSCGFSINEYDYEGDVWERCIKLHTGPLTLKFESVEDLMKWADRIKSMEAELRRNLE